VEEETNKTEEIVEGLLLEFKEQRDSLKLMILDLEKVKEKIDNLFPEGTLDKRYSRFFEEKVKSATGIFSALLDIRKEISRGLKDEIELRRKLVKEEKDFGAGLENLLDIGNLASKFEKLQKVNNKAKEKVDKNIIKEVKIDDPFESLKMGLQ